MARARLGRRMTVLASAGGLTAAGVIGLAVTAVATPAKPVATAPVARPVNHSNVAMPHSPQLMRQFAAAGGAPVRLHGSVMGPAAAASSVLSGAVQGIDVASYQHPNGAPINWQQVYGAGIRFAAVKVTEGTYYTNPYAAADLTQAKAAGLAVVGYAFAIPNGDGGSASAVAQADYAIQNGAGQHGNTPPIMLDIEYDPYDWHDGTNICYGLSQSAMQAWIKAFSDEVVARTGAPPVIYSTQGWWSKCVGSTNPVSGDPLWIASYTGTASPGTLPAGWSNWAYWQYSSGTVGGIPKAVTCGSASSPIPSCADLDQLNPALLTLLNPGSQQSTQNSPVSLQPWASEPTGVSYSATGLPSGLSITSSTGQITGTAPAAPSSPDPYTVTVTATDSASPPDTSSVTFDWYVHGTLTLTSPGDRSTVAGTPADFQVSASDSVATATAGSYRASGLPPGTFIAPAGGSSVSGVITGWPDIPGTYHVTVTGLDSLEAAGSTTFTWSVTAAPDSGPTGEVKLDLAGKCLNDVHNSSASGTRVSIWTCNGTTPQRWTYAADGTLRIHGKCLDTTTSAGSLVTIEPCSGARTEQWLLEQAPGKPAPALYDPAAGLCLSDPGSSRTNGTDVRAQLCNGQPAQIWTPPAGPLASEQAGWCANDLRNRTGNGNPVVAWSCNGTSAQQWSASPDGTVRIHNRCLNVRGGSSATAGAEVDLWTCNGSSGQKWMLVPTNGGVTLASAVPASLCLVLPGTGDGVHLKVGTCGAYAAANWRLR